MLAFPTTSLTGYDIVGLKVWPAGRIDENPSLGLSNSLKIAGFQLARLKTGELFISYIRNCDYG
jgi:tRNA U34 5-carboxymethylaminomethyl modifying enzyme MnmG/GidA